MNKKNKHGVANDFLRRLLIYGNITIVVLIVISTCTSVATRKPPSWGAYYEILLVRSPSLLKEDYYKVLVDSLQGVFPLLPQKEPHIKIITVDSQVFSSIHKKHRTILITEYSPDVSELEIKENLWARDQIVFIARAPSTAYLLSILFMEKENIKRRTIYLARNILKNVLLRERNPDAEQVVQEKLGIKTMIPSSYGVSVATDNRVILRREERVRFAGMEGSTIKGILLTMIPTLDSASLLQTIDSIMGISFIGSSPHETMSISHEPIPPLIEKSGDGRLFQVRGLWHLKNAFRGGPFYCVVTMPLKNDSSLLILGYVFSPGTTKREHMIEIETLVEHFSETFVQNS